MNAPEKTELDLDIVREIDDLLCGALDAYLSSKPNTVHPIEILFALPNVTLKVFITSALQRNPGLTASEIHAKFLQLCEEFTDEQVGPFVENIREALIEDAAREIKEGVEAN